MTGLRFQLTSTQCVRGRESVVLQRAAIKILKIKNKNFFYMSIWIRKIRCTKHMRFMGSCAGFITRAL